MDKRTKILVGLVITVLVALLSYFFIVNEEKQFSWTENYKEGDKNPYGLHVINSMLQSYFPKNRFYVINKSLEKNIKWSRKDGFSNYIFIGENYYLNQKDEKFLIDYVNKGNEAFISSKSIPYTLLERLNPDFCIDYEHLLIEEKTVNLNTVADSAGEPFNISFYKKNKPEIYSWDYFDTSCVSSKSVNVIQLGSINDSLLNFIKVKHGKGAFYFHTTPIAFTNYFLKHKDALNYSSKIFSNLKEGDIYWDEFSKSNFMSYSGNESKGPLQYILSQKGLRWAWYLTLCLVLLYVIFYAKRKQRAIPVIVPKINTSLEFVQSISKLYYQQNSNKKICEQKMKMFLYYIRNRYHISTKELDNELVKKISVKSDVDIVGVGKIFRCYKNIQDNTEISDYMVFSLYSLLDNFYKKAK